MPTPDNSMSQDSSYSRPNSLEDSADAVQSITPQLSKENSLLPPLQSSQSLPHLARPMSPPPSNQQRLPSLPALPPLSPPHYVAPQNQTTSWSQMRSPTSAPSNPFYSNTYRSSTPPLPSSAEESPLVSPAKRFSSGEVKPPFSPNSPRTPLNEEDRAKFAQVHPPLHAVSNTYIAGNTIKNASNLRCDQSRKRLGKAFILTNTKPLKRR